MLDLDALGKAEGENWVWKGSSWLESDYSRCLLSLSRGGADASVVREFDVTTGSFVEDGFVLPEAKSQVSWRDRDSVYVGTDFGEGSLTESGYPRVVKLWRRGTPLSAAELVAEGEVEDVVTVGYRDQAPGFERDILYRGVTFYTNEVFLLRDGQQIKIDKQDSANADLHQEWLLLELREDWSVGGEDHAAGSLLAIELEAFLGGERDFDVLSPRPSGPRSRASPAPRTTSCSTCSTTSGTGSTSSRTPTASGGTSRFRGCPSSARSTRRPSMPTRATTTG